MHQTGNRIKYNLKEAKDTIMGIRKISHSFCCFPSLLLWGVLLSPSTSPNPYFNISCQELWRNKMAFITSFQAKVIIGLEFWLFFFLFFFFSLNLVRSRIKWTTALISSVHTQGILKATDWKWSQKLAANPLVNLNSVCVGRGRVVPEFFGESVIKLNNCGSQKIRQYNLH